MGRPNTCHTCCPGDPVDPRDASECEKLVCIALIDSNGSAASTFAAKMAKWIEAYPDRLLFVMDVASTENVSYPDNFKSHDKAFSYFTVMGEKVIRDNGSLTNRTDVWNKITTMIGMAPSDIQALWSAAKEVSIYVKDAGSMTAEHVAGAVALLKTEIVDAGLKVVSSLSGLGGDVLCPFALEQCCINQAASDLRVLCGHDACYDPEEPGEAELLWGLQPDGAFVVDDPCDPVTEEPTDVCNRCPDVETADYTAKYKAYVKAADGQILDYPRINYTIQARNSSDDDWQDIYVPPHGKSNAEKSLNLLLSEWDPSAWRQVGDDLVNPDGIRTSRFELVSLSDDGKTVAVALYKSLEVRVYKFSDDDDWVQLGATLSFPGYVGDISLSDDGVFLGVGVPMNGNNVDTPKAYAYQLSGIDTWVQVGATFEGPIKSSLGRQVEIVSRYYLDEPSIPVLAISSTVDWGSQHGVGTNGWGQVNLFQLDLDTGTWSQIGSGINMPLEGNTTPLSPGVHVKNFQFGLTIALSNARSDKRVGGILQECTIAITSPNRSHEDTPNDYYGAAYIFRYDINVDDWTQVGGTIFGGGSSEGHWNRGVEFGEISINGEGNIIAIGRPGYPGATGSSYPQQSGWVHTHKLIGEVWQKTGDLFGLRVLSYRFGMDVSLNYAGDCIAVTEPGWQLYPDGSVMPTSGRAYILDWSGARWIQRGSHISGRDWSTVRRVSLAGGTTSGGKTLVALGQRHPTARVYEWFPEGECHPLISQYGHVSSCQEYTDVPIGGNCSRRVFKRDFRIKAEVEGLDAIYSTVFKLYKYIFQEISLSGGWNPAGRNKSFIHRDTDPLDTRKEDYPASASNIIKISNSMMSSIFGGKEIGGLDGNYGWIRRVMVQVGTPQFEGRKTLSEIPMIGRNGIETYGGAKGLGYDQDAPPLAIQGGRCAGWISADMVDVEWKATDGWSGRATPPEDFNFNSPPDRSEPSSNVDFLTAPAHKIHPPPRVQPQDRNWKWPIDNSANNRFAAFFASPPGVYHPSDAPLTAWASMYMGCSAFTYGPLEPPANQVAGWQQLDMSYGVFSTNIPDPQNVICINPSLELTRAKDTDTHGAPPYTLKYSSEKMHVIAVAGRLDGPSGGGEDNAPTISFFQLKPTNPHLNDQFVSVAGATSGGVAGRSFLWIPVRTLIPADIPDPLDNIWNGGDTVGRWEICKLMLSSDGRVCVAIYQHNAMGPYGWESSMNNSRNYSVIKRFETTRRGDASTFREVGSEKVGGIYSDTPSGGNFIRGAVLSFDGSMLWSEAHWSNYEGVEDVVVSEGGVATDNYLNATKISRMDAHGRIRNVYMRHWRETSWEILGTTTYDRRTTYSPAGDVLYRSLTSNANLTKSCFINHIAPTIPEEGRLVGLPLQRGVIETFIYDGRRTKHVNTFHEPGMADHRGNRYPASHMTNHPIVPGGGRPPWRYLPSTEEQRDRDFRGDISISADGKYLHIYTRGVFYNPLTRSDLEDYYMSSYIWDDI